MNREWSVVDYKEIYHKTSCLLANAKESIRQIESLMENCDKMDLSYDKDFLKNIIKNYKHFESEIEREYWKDNE